MKKNITLFLASICYLFITHSLSAQSNPHMDRPIQQCIIKNPDSVELLKKDFSIGHWLGKMIEHCDKLQSTSGKKGGPYVVALLNMEKELAELITLSDNCPSLNEPKVKTLLTEMKTIFQEKEKVETFQKGNTNDENMFDDDEVTTMSLTRNGAGKIKNRAEKLKKLLN